MSILKSTHSGKDNYEISATLLIARGYKRQQNKEGRDCFWWPNNIYGRNYFYVEYKSPDNPKWYYQYARYPREEVPQGPVGFYVNMCDLEYLITTVHDLDIVEQYWNVFRRPLSAHDSFEERIRLKNKILACNKFNLFRYDTSTEYARKNCDYEDLANSTTNQAIKDYFEFCKNYKR